MSRDSFNLSPVQQADQIRQVVGVLERMERRFADGDWASGMRFGSGGGNCLIGGVDEATEWTLPGVREEVTDRLVAHLPRGFQAVARVRPRVALALFNDTIGGRTGALGLVRGALADLGIDRRPRTVRAPAKATRDEVIDVRSSTWVS